LNKKLIAMNEEQCYAKVYGSLVFSVKHYFRKVKITEKGGFYIEEKNGTACINCSNDRGYTLDDLLWRHVFWGKEWGNTAIMINRT